MYLSMGNVLANPRVGLLFIDFERGKRMRLNGVASIDERDPLLADYPEAQLVVRVRATEVFPNCPRYIHQHAAGGAVAVRAARPSARRRSRPGSGATGRTTCWPPTIPPNDPNREPIDR